MTAVAIGGIWRFWGSKLTQRPPLLSVVLRTREDQGQSRVSATSIVYAVRQTRQAWLGSGPSNDGSGLRLSDFPLGG